MKTRGIDKIAADRRDEIERQLRKVASGFTYAPVLQADVVMPERPPARNTQFARWLVAPTVEGGQ
jgi:hypothetical protein